MICSRWAASLNPGGRQTGASWRALVRTAVLHPANPHYSSRRSGALAHRLLALALAPLTVRRARIAPSVGSASLFWARRGVAHLHSVVLGDSIGEWIAGAGAESETISKVRNDDPEDRPSDDAPQRDVVVFDEQTRQWRFVEDEVPTGYVVADGCAAFGAAGLIGGALIAIATWWRHRRRAARASEG